MLIKTVLAGPLRLIRNRYQISPLIWRDTPGKHISVATGTLIEQLLQGHKYLEHGYLGAIGFLSLAKHYEKGLC